MKKRWLRTLTLSVALFFCLCALPVQSNASTYINAANAPSAVYQSSPFYSNLLAIPLTGDGRTDTLAVALSQLGYTEGNADGEYGGNVGGEGNYTEYNRNMGGFGVGYGGEDYPWCASFVSFCLLQARCHTQTSINDWCRKHLGDERYIWREVSCSKWVEQLTLCGYFQNARAYGGSYIPIAGDLIFFTYNQRTAGHIGLVLYTDGDYIYTIEGNTDSTLHPQANGDGVYTKRYAVTDTYILGFGVLPYSVSNTTPNIDYSGASPTTGLYINTEVKHVYDTKNGATPATSLPKHTMVRVTEVADNGRLRFQALLQPNLSGYVDNNIDRIIPLSADNPSPSLSDASRLWGFCKQSAPVFEKNEASVTAEQPLRIEEGDTLCMRGWIGYTRAIDAFGYRFSESEMIWSAEAMQDPQEAELHEGGPYAKQYNISIPLHTLDDGIHRLQCLVKLTDGTIGVLGEITLLVGEVEANTTESPSTATPTTGTTTATPTEAPTAPATQPPLQTVPFPDTGEPSQTLPPLSLMTTAPLTPTDRPMTTDDATQAASQDDLEQGCQSSAGLGVLVIVTAAGLSIVWKRRKR